VVGEGGGAVGESIHDCDLIYSEAEEVGAAVARSGGRRGAYRIYGRSWEALPTVNFGPGRLPPSVSIPI
jgi:hypothetical protein